MPKISGCQATFDEKNIGISVFKYRRNKGEIPVYHLKRQLYTYMLHENIIY